MLKVRWFRKDGADCGTSITVTCTERYLVIIAREKVSTDVTYRKFAEELISIEGQ